MYYKINYFLVLSKIGETALLNLIKNINIITKFK